MVDQNGLIAETAWDLINIGLGAASLRENIASGNVFGAALDVAGLAVDCTAAAIPVVPGGAGAAIKTGRLWKGGAHTVYQSVEAAGTVKYIGITTNLSARAAAHLRSKGIMIDEIFGLTNLSINEARAVEQALIELHGLSKNGGTLINKINSIAKSNPSYASALQLGRDLLIKAGYPGI
jgi:predicted GIY-YIG superfamily endonuclease